MSAKRPPISTAARPVPGGARVSAAQNDRTAAARRSVEVTTVMIVNF